MKFIFLDRDGTILKEPPDHQIDSLEKLEFVPGVVSGLRQLIQHGYALVMVTNQDRLGSAVYPQESFDLVQGKMLRILEGEGVSIDHVFICPHDPEEDCRCRKPKTGLLDEFLRGVSMDVRRSWVLGDRETDVELAHALGCRSVRLTSDSTTAAEYAAPEFKVLCDYILRYDRYAHIERRTAETNITIDLLLDSGSQSSVGTGIGFFDHMLNQIALHAGIDLTVRVEGDLHVDEHHTVEDTGRALGEAFREALGDKRGIERFGFIAPLDESLARVVIDLSGRPYCKFESSFNRNNVGDLPTELVEEFFRAFADGLRATMHLRVEGRNDHHKIEALFKASGRALRQAIARNKNETAIPSTKGSL